MVNTRTVSFGEHQGQRAFVIRFAYPAEAHLASVLKRTLQRTFFTPDHVNGPCWIAFMTKANAKGVYALHFYYDFTIPDDMMPWADSFGPWSERTTRLWLSSCVEYEESELVKDLRFDLYPYQHVGVMYALNAGRSIIADPPGAGKTPQAIAWLHHLQLEQALIVCPASVKLNWARELLSWVPGLAGSNVTILSGQKTKVKPQWSKPILVKDETRQRVRVNDLKCRFIITNYDILYHWLERLLKYRIQAVVFDESHAISNTTARRTKAALKLTDRLENVLLLTGTPMRNRPKDLIGQLKATYMLDTLGGYNHYTQRYCDAHKTRFGMDMRGARHMDELQRIMRMNGFIRRDRSAILPQLPGSRWEDIVVEIANGAEYDRVVEQLQQWVREQVLRDEEFLKRIEEADEGTQGRAIAREQDRREYAAIVAEWLVRTAELRKVTARGKLYAAIEWVEQMLEDEEPVIIFAHHRDIQARLRERFPECLYITGGMKDQMRFEQIQRFRSGESDVMVLSTHAAGEGIDGLQDRCCHSLFVELDWSPAVMDQAQKRLDRIGQTQPVTSWRLIGSGTIDEEISIMLDEKMANISAGIERGENQNAIGMNVLRNMARAIINQ